MITYENVDDQSLGRWVSVLYRHFQLYLNRELSEIDINNSEYLFLIYLPETKKVNQKYLSEKLAVDKALTARAIKSLEKKGLIEKQHDEKDKRASLIQLTKKGKDLVPFIKEKLNNWTKILGNGIPLFEKEAIIKRLKEMANNAILNTKGEGQKDFEPDPE